MNSHDFGGATVCLPTVIINDTAIISKGNMSDKLFTSDASAEKRRRKIYHIVHHIFHHIFWATEIPMQKNMIKKNMMKNMIEICSAERRKSKLRLVQIGGFRMFETFRRSMMMTIPVNSIFKSNSKKELEGNN